MTPQEYFDPKQVIRRSMNMASRQPPSKGVVVYASSRLNKPLPNAWIALHQCTTPNAVWLAEWETTIPNYGCSCRKDYTSYKAENPPDFSSELAFFVWGVKLHNWVNRKLGKAELTIEEAATTWRRSDGLESQQDQSKRP